MPQLSMTLITFAAEDPGGWDHLFERATLLDRAGVDRLVVSDHVVFGENLEAYADPKVGGTTGGRQPTGPDGHWLEPLTVLSSVAAVTTRIRLGTNILLAALRRPVTLAKTLSTLDVLSKGRVDLGVGVGWQKEEYDAAGLEFERRGTILDEALAMCQGLWRNPVHQGFHMMPKPVQPGGIPVWVSGTCNRRVAQRIATYGSAWIPWGPAAADPATGIPEMRALVEEAGGDPSGLQIVGTLRTERDGEGAPSIDATVAGAPALVAAGATDLRCAYPIPAGAAEAEDTVGRLVEAFRAATA